MTNNKRRPSVIAKTLFLLFAIYASFTLISLQLEISRRKKEIESLNLEIVEQTTINDEMMDIIDGSMEDENIASIAREKLDYVIPGERVFVDTSSE